MYNEPVGSIALPRAGLGCKPGYGIIQWDGRGVPSSEHRWFRLLAHPKGIVAGRWQ